MADCKKIGVALSDPKHHIVNVPPQSPSSEAQQFEVGRSFTRDDPTFVAPWWSVNQTLTWIACRIPSYVEHVGNMESELFRGEARYLMTQAIAETAMAACDEALTFMESRRASWPEGMVLAHAGRELLKAIKGAEVKPVAIENGRGRAMNYAEFAGIGLSTTGGDWLDLSPQPLFASAEVMGAFSLVSPKGGRPAEIDWEAMKLLAESAIESFPAISRSKLADSLVAEYAEKVSATAPVKRTVERKLATWKLEATKPVSS